MARRWERGELIVPRGTEPEAAGLARYAARLLAAAATATAMSVLVASATGAAFVEPVKRAGGEASRADSSALAGDPAVPDPATPDTGTPKRPATAPTPPAAPGAAAPAAPASAVPAPGSPAASPGAAPSPDPAEPEHLSLTDDDGGRPLFLDAALVPGRPTARCLTVTYTGSKSRVPVVLRVEGSGGLARALAVRIELGTPGTGRGCGGFEPARLLARGTLAELAASHGTATTALPSHEGASGEAVGVRVTTELSPAAEQGAVAEGAFHWGTDG